MSYQIMGIILTSKDTTIFTTLHLISDFPDYVVDGAIKCEGSQVVKVTTVLDCAKLKIGDTVELIYAPSASGKPRLVTIKVVND